MPARRARRLTPRPSGGFRSAAGAVGCTSRAPAGPPSRAGAASRRRGSEASDPVLAEYFGHVSFVRPRMASRAICGRAPTSPTSPPRTIRSWKIDLSDDVIGAWRAEGDRGGDDHPGLGPAAGAGRRRRDRRARRRGRGPGARAGRPLHAGGRRRRRGFGDELYLEIRLWDRTLRQIATESLYADEGPPDG